MSAFWETPNVWTVSRLVHYLQALVVSADELQDLWVRGEISNVSRRNGHLFFTLKDPWGQIRCVMWREYAEALNPLPHDGQEVEVHGRVDLYVYRSQYQLYVDTLRTLGEGDLFREFLRLKAQLEAEGLFDGARKRPLPRFPRRIAVVTSVAAAALRDILHTLERRYPLVQVWLAPSLVQGEEAPAQLVAALRRAAQAKPDLIILARGGGSMEDLQAFNHEDVVRAVAASPVPVITGVGHETDYTLVDFAADHRAPTPTAAAEMATPDRVDLERHLEALKRRLLRAYLSHVERAAFRWDVLYRRWRQASPVYALQREQARLVDLRRRLVLATARFLERRLWQWQNLYRRLQAVNPWAPLERGYAWVTDAQGRTVRTVRQMPVGSRIRIHLRDGHVDARVEGGGEA